jgi:hypothetical protein
LARESIIIASATRARSPPESVSARRSTSSPEKPKRPRWPLHEPALPGGAEVLDDVVERLAERHLPHVLPVVRHLDRVAHAQRPGRQRAALADHRLEQRALAGAVGPDEAHHLAAREARGEVADEHALALVGVAHGERRPVGDEHLVAAALRDLQAERHHVLLARRRREARRAGEQLAPPLGLLGVLPGEVAADVVLLRRDHLALLVELPLLHEAPLGALGDEVLVRAGVRRHRPGLDVQHVVDHAAQEGAVVADEDHRAVGLPQVLLEPARGLEVEVVGGLVEEEHVAGEHELARQPHAPALAARELVEAARLGLLGVEAEPLDHLVDARVVRVAAVALEALEVAPVALHRRLGVVVLERRPPARPATPRARAARRGRRPPRPTPSSRRRSRGAARAA